MMSLRLLVLKLLPISGVSRVGTRRLTNLWLRTCYALIGERLNVEHFQNNFRNHFRLSNKREVLFFNSILGKAGRTCPLQMDEITEELKGLQIREAELLEELNAINIRRASIMEADTSRKNKKEAADMPHTNGQ